MCHGKKMCAVGMMTCALVTIGALNWGLVGLGSFVGSNLNVVNLLLGSWPVVENIVYILVGLAGLMKIFNCTKGGCCGGKCGAGQCCDSKESDNMQQHSM